MLQKLRSYPALVVAVPKYEQRIRGSVEQIKAVARLMNGSRLYINILINPAMYSHHKSECSTMFCSSWRTD